LSSWNQQQLPLYVSERLIAQEKESTTLGLKEMEAAAEWTTLQSDINILQQLNLLGSSHYINNHVDIPFRNDPKHEQDENNSECSTDDDYQVPLHYFFFCAFPFSKKHNVFSAFHQRRQYENSLFSQIPKSVKLLYGPFFVKYSFSSLYHPDQGEPLLKKQATEERKQQVKPNTIITLSRQFETFCASSQLLSALNVHAFASPVDELLESKK
jgi:hypothetical protein